MSIELEDPDFSSHVLYRFIDRQGFLLYVGITKNPPARFRRHGYDQDWWDEVVTIHLMHFGNRAQLLAAERHAIETEAPQYNRQLNYSPTTNQKFDVVPCPVCGLNSFYRYTMDRYYHVLGKDNRECWIAISNGSFKNDDDRTIDRHGHPIPNHLWKIFG